MKKTKLVPITSLDQLEVGSIIVDKNGDRRKILAKTGLLVWTSAPNQFNRSVHFSATLEELKEWNFQLEVAEESWVPKEGESYYYPDILEGKAHVDKTTWVADNRVDNSRLKVNLVCKTREEALAKAQKMLDSIKDSE